MRIFGSGGASEKARVAVPGLRYFLYCVRNRIFSPFTIFFKCIRGTPSSDVPGSFFFFDDIVFLLVRVGLLLAAFFPLTVFVRQRNRVVRVNTFCFFTFKKGS